MCKFGNKMLIMFYIVLPLLLTTSCAPTLVDRVKAFQEAANSHNAEKLLSFYADDVRFEIVGTPVVIVGKENLRRPIEEQFILNVHLTFTDIKVNGNTVTYKVKEQNDWLKARGADAVYYEYDQITFEDGLIKEEKAKPSEESLKRMIEFQASFERWVSETRPEEWVKLRVEGMTKENVDKWLMLARNWREETEQGKK